MKRPSAPRGAFWAAILAAFLSSCAALAGPAPNPFEGPGARRLSIVVENRSGETVTVDAVGLERDVNLGPINDAAQASFFIPWQTTGPLRFSIYQIGGRSYTTSALMLAPGDEVELWVQDPIETSVVHR